MANRKQIQDQAIRNSLTDNKITHTMRKQQRGYPDLKSEVRNRLGMNQASSMWQTMKYMKTKPNNKVLPMRKQFYEEV